MAHLMPSLIQTFVDANGDALAGGKVYFYEAGTSTPLAAYQDQGETIPNTNPVILDANGQANIWLVNQAYKIVLTDADDNTLVTRDNVTHIATGSILTALLADDAVTSVKISNSAVTTAKIDDEAVTNQKLAPDAVNGAKIADDSIDSEHYVDGSIDTAHIAAGAVTIDKIAALAVTLAKLGFSRSIQFQVFTSSGTYIKPAGLKQALVIATGGGGPGGNSVTLSYNIASAGGGGGAGGTAIKLIAANSLASTEAVPSPTLR